MKSIAFIDTEIAPKSGRILDIGSVKGDGSSFHSASVGGFTKFISGSQYICGHNIFHHDLKYIHDAVGAANISESRMIDTLFLSPLLFPRKPYHALLKDDKLQTEDSNNPLNDSKKAKDLFFDEVTAFRQLDSTLQQIYYALLKDKKEFCAFFEFIDFRGIDISVEGLIREKFHAQICEQADLGNIIWQYPVELSYCLALINTNSRYSVTPPWVVKNYPAVERIMYFLRNKPCLQGCAYCNMALDIHKGLQQLFGFESFRTFAGEPLQEQAVQAAIDNKSILAVFPTGGGKSLTFQVPALMAGVNTKGLTVVISPLQSLMKDQVDNLEKAGITDAVTINGLLDPIERAKSFERVEDGSASILYISPESLRSKTIERLLLGRNVVRFVIDEAHCFSSWGQDFRVDYLYIGVFIKSLQEKKNSVEGIPVSCFTATAKPKVIEDIRQYFKEKLSLDLQIYRTNTGRSNLRYKVYEKESEEDKYNTVRDLLQEKNCPTIIYVSRTRKAYLLAERLTNDGFQARPYHGQMDKQEKTENQDAFISGAVQIIVATSAFGMGVDKKDVGMVIHYEISDSLENYIQEAGRAGRDENILADCFVLFNDDDLSKHFVLLNQTKLSIQEIQQVWRTIKEITRFRAKVSQSALEIARKAGWDDSVIDIETRVATAIAALEEAGYLKRGQNMPRVFANSILSRNVQEAIKKINRSNNFEEKQKEQAIRIIKKLFSSKSRQRGSDETAESRVDYISDHLGIPKQEVIEIVNLLRLERILADSKDLAVFIKKKEKVNRSLNILESYWQIEKFLLSVLDSEEEVYHIKKLNAEARESGCKDVNPNKIKTIFNIWAIKHWIKKQAANYSKNHIAVLCLYDQATLLEKSSKRHELARFIVEYLYNKSILDPVEEEDSKEELLVEFSVLELIEELENRSRLFNKKVTPAEIEDALFYLSRIEALKIEGGFLVTYNALTIERIEKDNRIRYKIEDYQKLNQFYQSRMQQIHIVGEYARKMLEDYKAALQFVDDYFQLNYSSFLNKYFKGSRQNEIKRNITPAKFKQLFGQLSPTQLRIINDNESKYIVVAAGPGSGKTRILVHKLASLLLMEDVKQEQLLMVTFSRAAATEFKKRLIQLIGSPAHYVEIKTFHSYCFDLLGRVGTIEKSDEVIQEAVRRIKSGEVEAGRITKTVLVIDEAQDMDAHEFALINALIEQNEDMRIIAVGDDDQNIYEFRGASSEYLKKMIDEENAVVYELLDNYRSKSNLVDFANQWVRQIPNRLKQHPIEAVQKVDGKVELISYWSSNLATPLVNYILSAQLTGSTCILTRTNQEAVQVTGLLLKNGLPAKLIQSNEGFNIYNLLEIRYFISRLALDEGIYTISDDVWLKAKRDLRNKFRGSLNLEIITNVIRDFEATNPETKYISDLEIFIRESKMEDFVGENIETIFVSTIHKAKGREFDNVFLLLDGFKPVTDEAKRLLYVAMTRARNNLIIHCNGNYLNEIRTEELIRIIDVNDYAPPAFLAMQLTHSDVWLDFFKTRQNLISQLNSGDMLAFDGDYCSNLKGQPVLRVSKKFGRQIEAIKQKNYVPEYAKIKYIVYWRGQNSEDEIKIVLPEIHFQQ